MISIILEVKGLGHDDFYNPSPGNFRRFPRTQKGYLKAIKELTNYVLSIDWVQDFRFVIYEGKYEYYKDNCKCATLTKDNLSTWVKFHNITLN